MSVYRNKKDTPMKRIFRSPYWQNRRTVAAAGFALLLLTSAATRLHAQDAPPAGEAQPGAGRRFGGGQGGPFASMPRVAGEVVSVSGANVTVKAEDGSTMTVVTTDNTRIMKGRGGAGGRGGGMPGGAGGPGGGAGAGMGGGMAGGMNGGMPETIKASDLKPGDGITAIGNLDAPTKTLHAAMVIAVDASVVKAMRDNLGKTYITGRVTAIDLDNAKLTIERPDHVAQTIGLDESTSFRKGRMGRMGGGGQAPGAGAGSGAGTGAGTAEAGESITLADVKVGDQVVGQGEVKGGTFVPKQLVVMTPGQGGGRRRGEGQPAPPASNPGAATPPLG